MHHSFSELSVKGESEKLVAKWVGRIQRGLPLFSVNSFFEMGDTCVQI